MRTGLVIAIALATGWNASGQEPKAAVVQTLQQLDARVFKPDSAETKLRWDSVRLLREEVNQRDVATWRSLKTRQDWEKLRDERLAALKRSLGNFPPAPREVKAVTTKKLESDGVVVSNLLYESRPNFYVTANLYAPAKPSQAMPGFIIVHSHHNPKTQGELQDMGLLWARQGCLVLVPDLLGHGERRQHPFTDARSYPEAFKVGRQDYYFRYNTAIQLHLVGESLMGFMVWDLMRGLDVLYQQPGLDRSKVMMFGSVAGGGDPSAVFAALDPRVTAAAPFNFGGPQPETKFPLPDDAERSFNYLGGGSWESTRNLRLSGRDGFLPWVIVGSLAPRGLIYGHEFAWDQKNDPVWARFTRIWGDFYNARDRLAAATGRGSVRGQPPESTHCNNIGVEHRKPIYPTLQRWFGLPIPEENKKRFDASELQCWTEEARQKLQPKLAHQIARDMIPKSKNAPAVEDWIDLLGVPAKSPGAELLRQPGAVKPIVSEVASDAPPMKLDSLTARRIVLRHPTDATTTVPMVVLRLAGKINVSKVVIGLAQDGKQGFLKHRAETIADLVLKHKVAVCLPDLRGTGETANDGRGRSSGATSYSASLQMHGQTVPGVQAQELALVMNGLQHLGYSSIALWGDSFAEPNDPKMNFAVPLDAARMPRQSEPMGATLALLGGVFGGDAVKAVYTRGGLVSFRSLLNSPFCYFPHDAVIPGVLRHGDLDSLAAANSKRGVRMEGQVDGLNRRVDQKALMSPAELAAWLAGQLR